MLSRRMLVLVALVVGGTAFLFGRTIVQERREAEREEAAEERRRQREERKDDLLAYEEAIDPIFHEGGRIVVEGLRPAITDIREGAYPDEQLVAFSEGQLRQMRDLKQQFLDVEPPSFARRAFTTYVKAFDGYIAAARKLLAAARATGEERQRLVDEVAPIGEEADDVYDRARAMLDEERRKLGLDPAS